ncbi:MAG TPA: alpha/beta fold hydrolase [Ktedonobacteraceae bacterium]|jgi:2,6-dihydroxypseudooxynicotine hydrolase|nr:alpha/beta fold hydrolase [Ktedonobacteraceae bacterium]
MARDEQVQSAIDNWAPRFVANGVDTNDFQRVTNSIEHWDDWCRMWSECGAMHEHMGEQAEAKGYYESAGYHYFHAAISYHFGKYLFVHKPQELRIAHEHVVRDYTRALPYFDFPGERVLIPYEGGATMYGILRKPWHTAKPPVVILVPGLDSVKEELHVYGDDFLKRGMAVLAIDGPGQGEMEFEHPMRHDFEVPVRYAIDYLESRSDVDANYVGMMGVSLGGYYAPRAAAFEPRIKAVIANAGGYNIESHFERLPQLTRDAFVYRTKSTNELEAREKLQAFDLQGVMKNVRNPLLVIMGRLDRLIPPADAEKMVAEAGGEAELWMFEDGNHVNNNIVYKHRPQQADWMRKSSQQFPKR